MQLQPISSATQPQPVAIPLPPPADVPFPPFGDPIPPLRQLAEIVRQQGPARPTDPVTSIPVVGEF